MEGWRNSAMDDFNGSFYDVDSDDEGWKETRKWQIEEAEEVLRKYYETDNISWAKGKEERMADSAKENGWDEEGLKWIKNGWKWFDKDEDKWKFSPEGRVKTNEYWKKLGIENPPDRIFL